MNTDIFTYFTRTNGVSQLLYSAEDWMRVSLVLETAGPVAVGTRESVVPVLSGKGILLDPTGIPSVFTVPKGNRIYIAAEAVNRVKVVLEPIPWLEQILFQIESGFGGLKGIMGAVARAITKSPSLPPTASETCPPPPTIPAFLKGRK